MNGKSMLDEGDRESVARDETKGDGDGGGGEKRRSGESSVTGITLEYCTVRTVCSVEKRKSATERARIGRPAGW